jgi:hypothetical protein
MLNPGLEGGAVTVIAPQGALTEGAGGAMGKITTLTMLLVAQAPGPAVNAAVVPQALVNTYLAAIE